MDTERGYFPIQDEWSQQERDFARRAIKDIGLDAWNDLMRMRETQGNGAFADALLKIWPGGAPPN
ncbi:MAG: hypothetical protein HYS18_04225 [Burkholderiales bacterium]|nr:hypothetical protein [Burkholderiales bacterium]